MTTEQVIAINSEPDVITARHVARSLSAKIGFSHVDQARITTAVSELARNIVIYGVRGTVTVREARNAIGKSGIEIAFDDVGPGIADIHQAMTQGFTSGGGLGAGLPGSRRLMDDFEIRSEAGLHVLVRKWR